MKALKNPIVAVLLAVVLVAASTYLSASSNLKKDTQKITDGFYSGVKYDGSKHASIYSQLNGIIGAVDGMCAIAANNGVDTAALSAASTELKADLSTMHDDIASIYLSYSKVCSCLTPFLTEMDSAALSEHERGDMQTYEETVTSARRAIDESGYNESVRAYRGSLDRVAELFISLCDVAEPEYFA